MAFVTGLVLLRPSLIRNEPKDIFTEPAI